MSVKNTSLNPAGKITAPASAPKEDTPFISFLKKQPVFDATKFVADASCDLSARGIDSCALYRNRKNKDEGAKKLFRRLSGLSENADLSQGHLNKQTIAKGIWKILREIRNQPADKNAEVNLDEPIKRKELDAIIQKRGAAFGSIASMCRTPMSGDSYCIDWGFAMPKRVQVTYSPPVLHGQDIVDDTTVGNYVDALDAAFRNPDGSDSGWEEFYTHINSFDGPYKQV